MRYEVKSIGIWAFLKVSFFFNLVIGFLLGLLYAVLVGFLMSVMSRLPEFYDEFGLPMDRAPIGFMMVVIPIFFAVLGAIFCTIGGVIMVLIYNLIARIAGGLEVDLERVILVPSATQAGPPPADPSIARPYIPPASPAPKPPWVPLESPRAPESSSSPSGLDLPENDRGQQGHQEP